MEIHDWDSANIYGAAAADSLRGIEQAIRGVAEAFSNEFYETLARAHPIADVISRLSPEEFDHLKSRQAEYLGMLLAPDLTAESHATQAHRAGTTHALVGVAPTWLIESYALFQHRIHAMLRDLLPLSERRERTQRVVDLRALYDLREQLTSYDAVSRGVASVLASVDRHVLSAANLSDLVREVFASLAELDGDVSGFFGRADAQGDLQFEATFGVADRYYQAMESGVIPKISIAPNVPAGQGPSGRAWRTGHVVVSNAWMLEPDRAPWRSVGGELGFRSSAAIPLSDESGRTVALITLYSGFPGFFSTNRIGKFLGHLHHVLSRAVALRMHAPVIPLLERQTYRGLLEAQRVAVLYQPIVSLKHGELVKVEALARLLDDDDDLIPAERFLPAFGEADLRELFERVLGRACSDLRTLERGGIRTRVSINIPAQALGDTRYRAMLLDTLGAHGLDAQRVTLEVLETSEDTTDVSKHQGFLASLRDLGVEIEQDDLGSAHSSLVRLDQYPFDGVKIDQALVRGATRNPQRALEFILYLSRLAHALSIPATVEGLEHPGMIEAAALLGADRGQGYGIAMPMPASELAAWHKAYRYPVDVRAPRTALGAMAGYLLWDLQLSELARWPNLRDEFAQHTSAVERFVEERSLHGTPLDEHLRRAHEHARNGSHDALYKQTRLAIIDALRVYCLTER
ncbi:MAG: EAL domain-containing protein [bacterium]|nr:EAL domain-containing protein [bacterium]